MDQVMTIVAGVLPLLVWLAFAALLGVIYELLRGGVHEVSYTRGMGYCVDCECTQRLDIHGMCARCGSDSIVFRRPPVDNPGILDKGVPPVLQYNQRAGGRRQ